MLAFGDLYFLPGQLAVLPLLDHEEVSTETIIGTRQKKPLKLRAPIYVSHMSFGALSKEAKLALALGSAEFGTVMCSGEGGMFARIQRSSQSIYLRDGIGLLWMDRREYCQSRWYRN